MSDQPVKFLLSEQDIPASWTNLLADLPGELPPPLNPRTLEPAGPPDLTPIFPIGLIEQEVSSEPEVAIPEQVLDAYKLWRPTPLFRARRFERALETPARIYYKYEGVSPAGSHKPNTVLRRLTRTHAQGSSDSPRRRARVNGAPLSPSPARCSAWSARYSWSVPHMTRSHTGAR